MNIVYLGLGTNLGDKDGNIRQALRELVSYGTVLEISSLISTLPVGYENQPDFVNAACKLETALAPLELLEGVEEIMTRMGRVRTLKNGPRPIDIDILLFNDMLLRHESLIIPHPRMLERSFVLEPLTEIAPDVVHPLSNRTIASHYSELISTN